LWLIFRTNLIFSSLDVGMLDILIID
jgi:hypothetical protein